MTRRHTFVFLGCFHRLQGHRVVSVRCREIYLSSAAAPPLFLVCRLFPSASFRFVLWLTSPSFVSTLSLQILTIPEHYFMGKKTKKKQRRRRWGGEYGLLPRGFPQRNRALRQIKSEVASVGSTEGKKKSLFFFSSSCFICMLFPFSSRPFRLTSLTSRGCLAISPLRDD